MTAARPLRLRPFPALLVSAFVLPGLGQILSGRPLRGALMIGALTLSLFVLLFKVALDVRIIWPALSARLAQGEAVTLAAVQAAAAPLAGGLVWALGPLLAVWLWSLIDALVFIRRRGEPVDEAGHAVSSSG